MGGNLQYKEVENMRALGTNMRADGSTGFRIDDRLKLAGPGFTRTSTHWKKVDSWERKLNERGRVVHYRALHGSGA